MSFDLIKDFLLVILGGFVAFIFNIIITKIKRREPKIEWRKLPDLKILSQGLTGLSWFIENTGKISSKNVRMTFTLPEKASFQSFEIETSEPALEYNIIDKPDIRKKTIELQTFPQNITISVSALISDLFDKNVKLSIVSEEIVGIKKRVMSRSEFDKYSKILKWLFRGMIVFFIISIIGVISWVVLICNESFKLEQTKHIAEIHEIQNKYDDAIKIYKEFQSNSIFFHDIPIVNFKIARLYAMKNDSIRCLLYLKNTIKEDKKFISNIESEKAFDSITLTTEYKDIIKELNKK